MDLSYSELRDLYARLRADNNQRNGEYETSRERVNGELWDADTNPRPNNRYSLSLNYLLPIAQKHVQLLMGRLPAIQVPPVGVEEEHRRHAEKLEGVLYSSWYLSNAQEVFQRVAWDSFVLRRGLVYYWWDAKHKRARFRYVVPDNFYPEYDDGEVYRALYVYRRMVDPLKEEYPKFADGIVPDPPMDVEATYGQDQPRQEAQQQITVMDYYDRSGQFIRVAGDQILERHKLAYPDTRVPFIEFPFQQSSGNAEPQNGIDQLTELVQYLSQLVSQKADVIRTYANPTIIDEMSGQAPDEIRRAVAAEGSVLPVAREGNIRFLNWDGAVPTIDEQITLILDTIFDISGKPRSAFGQTITNQSGVATNMALTPTLQSNEAHESIWGIRLSLLNRMLLQLTEKFGGEKMHYRGMEPIGADSRNYRGVELEFNGKDIAGWYESRIKWPSAIRTDDPVYVQNIVSQLTSDPPTLSLYTALELLGHEDVEAEVDRILEQKEDPRLSADTVATNAQTMAQAGPGTLPGGLLGTPPPTGGGPNNLGPPAGEEDAGLGGEELMASGSPATEELA